MTIAEHYRIRHSEFLEWDQLDRDKAIWWHVRKSETCAGCGTREVEWDPDQGGDRLAYGTDIRQCRGCAIKQAAEASSAFQDGGHGLYVRMRRN